MFDICTNVHFDSYMSLVAYVNKDLTIKAKDQTPKDKDQTFKDKD